MIRERTLVRRIKTTIKDEKISRSDTNRLLANKGLYLVEPRTKLKTHTPKQQHTNNQHNTVMHQEE